MRNEIISLVSDYAAEKLKPKDFVPGKTRIPASSPSLSQEDVETLTEAVLSLWYTEGKFCAKFRQSLRNEIGKTFVTLCNSGSSASLLAMKSCLEHFGSKDYVITCGVNFPTTVAPIYQCGQIPIYIDIDPKTLTPNIEQLEQAVWPGEFYQGPDRVKGLVSKLRAALGPAAQCVENRRGFGYVLEWADGNLE